MGKIGKFLTTAAAIATLGYNSSAVAQQIDQTNFDNFPIGVTECMDERLNSKKKFYKERHSLDFVVGMESTPSIRRGNVLYGNDTQSDGSENIAPGTLVHSCASVDLKWHYFYGLRAVNTYTKFKSDDGSPSKSTTNVFLKFTPVYVDIMFGIAGSGKRKERVLKVSTTKQSPLPFDFSYLRMKPIDRIEGSTQDRDSVYGEFSINTCFDGTRIGGEDKDDPRVFGCLTYTRGEGVDYFVPGRVSSKSFSGSVNLNILDRLHPYLKLTKHKIDGPEKNGFKDYEGTELSLGVFVKI